MPVQSEETPIPANADLTPQARQARIDGIYRPFSNGLEDVLTRHSDTLKLMITVHSFTPVYKGTKRAVELGLLHGKDARFATGMLAQAAPDLPLITRLNEPYAAADGVAHTLDRHAAPHGLQNVMIEIRNDLIQTPEQQQAMADCLAPWIDRTWAALHEEGGS